MAYRPAVLVCTGDPDIQDVLRRVLAPDYSTFTLPLSAVALGLMMPVRVDLVVLHVNDTPRQAMQAMRALRSCPGLAAVPFVVIHNSSAGRAPSAPSLNQAMLATPFSVEELRRTVADLIALAEHGDAPEYSIPIYRSMPPISIGAS